jgi:hypothetical protein
VNLLAGIVTLLMAFAISGVAAYFSVIGLAALFAAAFWPVVVMGGVLEIGKLVAAAWLHANWRVKEAGRFLKAYMLTGVAALMLVTGIGIYGYLAKGHLDQQAGLPPTLLRIERIEADIAKRRDDLRRLADRQRQLDSAVDTLIGAGAQRVQQAQQVRDRQRAERTQIAAQTEAANQDIARLSEDLVPLRLVVSENEVKLGPVRYVAELLGWSDTNSAVRLLILILMFAFDPMAVALVLAGTISIRRWSAEREALRPAPVPVAPTPLSVPTPPPAPPAAPVEAVPEVPTKETSPFTPNDEREWLRKRPNEGQ